MTEREVAMVGARLADGSGSEPVAADVLVRDGRIEAVIPQGQRPMTGYDAEMVDIRGLILAPGFVDIHTHSDLSLFAYPGNESRVTQGITTEVVGNCGMSPAPVPDDRHGLAATIATIDVVPGVPWQWRDPAGWLGALSAAQTSTNVAALIGHGSCRFAISGPRPGALRPAELTRLELVVAQALEAGCLGVSVGLMYSPGEHADGAELAVLATVVARFDGVLTAHLRDYRRQHLLPAVAEMLQAARAGTTRLQVSHLRAIGSEGEPEAYPRTLDHIGTAQSEVDVEADVYPYITGHTTLTQLLPPGLRSLGLTAVTQACHHRPGEVAAMFANADYRPESVTIMKAPNTPEAVGTPLSDVTGDPWAWLTTLLRQNEGNVDVAVTSGRWADVDRALLTPWVSIASDGTALDTHHTASVPHPRSWGTFPAAYRRMRDLGVPVGEVVRRMTCAPADRVGLTSGIRPGHRADLVAFHDDALDHPGTFTDPATPATGISHVLVNGTFVLRDGAPTAARPGVLLRSAA